MLTVLICLAAVAVAVGSMLYTTKKVDELN